MGLAMNRPVHILCEFSWYSLICHNYCQMTVSAAAGSSITTVCCSQQLYNHRVLRPAPLWPPCAAASTAVATVCPSVCLSDCQVCPFHYLPAYLMDLIRICHGYNPWEAMYHRPFLDPKVKVTQVILNFEPISDGGHSSYPSLAYGIVSM